MSQNAYVLPEGAFVQTVYGGPDVALPAGTALGAGATKRSSVMLSRGAKTVAASVQASQAGTARIDGWLDVAGTVSAWFQQVTLVAGVPQVVNAPVGIPFASWSVSFTNTNATAGTCQVNGAIAQA